MLEKLFSNPIAGIISEAGQVIDSLTTSDEERAEGKRKLEALYDAPWARQAAITLQEAKHPSVWVSGWRPFIGWVCGAGLATAVVIWPVAAAVANLMGIEIGENPVNTGLILAILPALLGVAGLRSWEKSKGVARNNMKP